LWETVARFSAPGEGSLPPGFHHRPVTKRNRSFAKTMRRNATDVEGVMWRLLRHRRLAGFKFRRQVPFQDYILDFVCFERKIVIETDGSQHFESKRDQERDLVLSGEGFRVLCYWNNDVLQRPASVLEDIFARLADDGR
jgi:very-short-patch-repair endonuclease